MKKCKEKQNRLPGTNIPCTEGGGIASVLGPGMAAAGGMTLGQICRLTDLKPFVIQNWIKRGAVPHPENKRYTTRHLARILLVASLREIVTIEDAANLLRIINGDTDREDDDLLTEEALYDIFADAVLRLGDRGAADGAPEQAAADAAAISGLPPEERERVERVLTAMLHAYTAAEEKRKADRCFRELNGGMSEKGKEVQP